MATFVLLLALALMVYVAFVGWAYTQQRQMQYGPTQHDSAGVGNDFFAPWKDPNGKFLGYIRKGSGTQKAVVFFHGNGGEALDRTWVTELVPPSTLLILAEYPGYGAKPGKPSQQSILEDAEKTVQEIRSQFGNISITAIGESLGSAVAGYLASKSKVERVAFISPFSSMCDVAKKHFPLLPTKLLLKDRFMLTDFAKDSKAPVRIIHGTLDDLVPIEMGKRVFDVYGSDDKMFCEIPGFGHNNLDAAILHSPFANRFRQFLEV